ncbi:hypothetical protein HanPSC8_Chr09g0375671 [Helianthus annuus]|nr:hypothetical protein HanPSC8_Chr09g0375671 [Helianthus annuus]
MMNGESEILLYFERDENGGLILALQEDSAKKGKVTIAGMYFLGFPVYKLDQQSSLVSRNLKLHLNWHN